MKWGVGSITSVKFQNSGKILHIGEGDLGANNRKRKKSHEDGGTGKLECDLGIVPDQKIRRWEHVT